MPRHSCFASLLLLVLLFVTLSCAPRPAPEAQVEVEEPVGMVPPPYRIALVSSRKPVSLPGFPDGMLVGLESDAGRLVASSPVWKALVELADDETLRAIVIADAPLGTAALFMHMKERRPELLLVALLPEEPPLVIQAAADMVMDFDHVMRAYTTALMASRMGRSQIVLLSLPAVADDWRMNTRRAVLHAASADMDLSFNTIAVPPDGLEKALRDLGAEIGTGIEEMVIVVNHDRLASEALRIADAAGALFVELHRPEDGYAGQAPDVEQPSGSINVPAGGDPVRAMIDTARNVPGRPGLTLVWPGEQALLLELGALTFVKSIVDGKPASEEGLATMMNVVWPAGQWHASHFVDPRTGVRARNHLLTGADPYLVGRSYLSSESRHMPMKYRQVASQ